MLAFVKSQPNVIERLLSHVETPAIVDLLLRILQLEDQPGGAGVIDVRGLGCFAFVRAHSPSIVAILAGSHTSSYRDALAAEHS